MPGPLSGHGALPTELVIGGGAFPVRHDFRDGIRFEEMMLDRRVPEPTRVTLAIEIWFGDRPDADLGAVIAAMLDFYRCGKAEVEVEESRRLYSYNHDWDAIFAGFLSAYGIDLLDPETHLHWWKFRSMLSALPDDSQFMRIIGYRSAKTVKGMSSEQRAHIRKMQRIYALPGEPGMVKKRIGSKEELQEVLAAIQAAKDEAAK